MLDVNMLVALGWPSHLHHHAAHRWFAAEADQGWATCILTQSGFVRVSMNPAVVGVRIDCSMAMQSLETLTQLPHHQYIADLPSFSTATFAAIARRIQGHRQVSDAILLHAAFVHGMRFVTFDKSIATLCPWTATLEICAT